MQLIYPETGSDKSQGWWLALLLGALGLLVRQYVYGYVDHTEQLPMIFRQLDPGYLQNDFFVNATALFGPRFYFVRLVAFLARAVPLPALFLIFTYAVYVAVAWLSYATAYELFGHSRLGAALAAASILAQEGFGLCWGTDFLLVGFFIPGLLVRPFLYYAVASFLRDRPWSVAAAAALSTLFHPTLGMEVGLLLLGLSALFRRRRAGAWLAPLAGLALLAAAGWLLWGRHPAPRIADATFIELLARFRHPAAYLPSSFHGYKATVLFLLALFLSWRWWMERAESDRAAGWRLLSLVAALLLLGLGGYLFVEVWPTRLWTTANLFRLFFILKWLGVLLIAATVARLLERREDGISPLPAAVILAGNNEAYAWLVFGGHVAVAAQRCWARLREPPGRYLFAALLLSLAAAILYARGLKRETCGVGMMLAVAIAFAWPRRRAWRFAAPALLTGLGIAAVFFPSRPWNDALLSPLRLLRPVYDLSQQKRPREERPLVELAAFAKAATPPQAVFLTPPDTDFGRFRLLAERAMVVSFLEFPFQEPAMVEWKKRLDDCYGDSGEGGLAAPEAMARRYAAISDAQLARLAATYGAAYAVLRPTPPTRYPVLFANQAFRLVRLLPPPGDRGRDGPSFPAPRK